MNNEAREQLIAPSSNEDNSTNAVANGINADSTKESKKCSSEKITILYGRRWYIILVYSYFGFLSNMMWNTWGPIAKSSEAALNWTDGEIGMLANWGPISFLISSLFLAWLMDVKGMRVAAIVLATAIFIGASLRCITPTPPAATWLIHAGQFVAMLGGPVAMAGPPLVSSTWFPANQRATATALSASLANLGLAASFLLGPYLVSEYKEMNGTAPNMSTDDGMSGFAYNISNNLTDSYNNISQIRNEIQLYMFIVAGMAGAGFLTVLIYFPAAPPTPPSHSAKIKRMPYKEGLKRIFSSGAFWILCIPYALGGGFFDMWGGVTDVIVSPLGVTEKTAGWAGFYGILAGQVSQILVGRFSDIFARRMKLFLIVLYTVTLLSFVAFALMCSRLIPNQLWIFYVTFILINASQSGAVPLFFELVCEALYPVSEGITNTVLTLMNNVTGLGFALLLLIPNIGSAWMNWTLAAVMFLCIPVLCCFKEHYGRLDIDVVDAGVPSGHVQNVSDENCVTSTAPFKESTQNI